MADPICRWRNPYVSTIIELVKILPHEVMPSDKFRTIVEKRWPGFLHTPYQLACQVGLYYESDDGIYYPRFDHDIDETEAFLYMKRWITRYYVPNPYTKSLKTLQQPQPFLASIIGYIYKHPNEKRLHSILEAVFQENIGNIDIISNVLNTYTDLMKIDGNGDVELTVKASDFMKEYIDRYDKKAFFEYFSENELSSDDKISKNLIYYGAPGTGKSHKIKDFTEGKEVIRTTFHPDSDYSTFVGAYKPTTIDADVVNIMGREAVNVKNPDGSPRTEKKIIYEFVPQAFLQAYVNAWKLYAESRLTNAPTTPKEQFLIIEEINRGNCAQIFGDLFQLLDRDNEGFSDYYIKADKDLQKYLEKEFKDVELYAPALCGKSAEDISKMIKFGEILLLPNNLHIWATMNTSDQSLFPIDSAFKRRWDWQYMPIGYKNTNWVIEIGEKKYNWVDFQREINQRIFDVDNSEDKQLGDYFVNADRTGNIISADTLLNKVLFYLWNDVCKDDPEHIFRWIDDKKEKNIKFSDFFCDKEECERKLQGFMAFIKVKAIGESDSTDTPTEDDDVVNA